MAKINKKLFYKIGLPIGSIGTIVAPLATLVACEDGTGTSSNPANKWQFGSHRIVQMVDEESDGISFLETKGLQNFLTPLSTSNGNGDPLGNAHAAMALSLFRYVQPKGDQYQLDSNGKIVGIVASREIALRFEMIEKLTITFTDGHTAEFDDDGDDVTNPRNINGQNFKDELAKGGVKNFKFSLRKDIDQHHWIQQLTGEKGSKITSKDLWRTTFLRLFAIGKNRAESLGVSLEGDSDPKSIKKIDAKINAKAKQGYTPLSTGSASQSAGFFKSLSYGVDNDLFLNSLKDENARKQIIPDDFTFNIPFNDPKDGITTLKNWDDMFGKGTAFVAVPNKEIEDLIVSEEETLKGMMVMTSDSKNAEGKMEHYEFTEADWEKFKTTDLYKSGYLQWVTSLKEKQYVAGKYYFSQSTAKLWVASINEDYVDPRWLNQKNSKGELTTIKEFRMKTIQESQVSKLQLGNEYLSGTSVSSSFENLSPSQQASALNDIQKWGLSFTKGYTGAKMLGDFSFAPLLPFQKGTGKVYYNNNFSKAMFGDTSANYLKSQTPEDLITYEVSGLGAQFRSNLLALINKTAFLKTGEVTNSIGWDAPFAPEGTIGPDANGNPVVLSSVIGNPTDAAANGVDEEKVVGINVVRIENGIPKIYPISTNSYLENLVDTSINRYGPSNKPSSTLPLKPGSTTEHYSPYEFVKENIKEVLDATVGPIVGDVKPEQLLTFEFPYGRGLTFPKYNVAYKEFQQYLKTIDPRLNMVAAVKPALEADPASDATTAVIGDETDGEIGWTDFNTSPSSEIGKLYSFIERLYAGNKGYSFASLNPTSTYDVNSPSAVLASQIGYQQSGLMLSLSYFAANPNLLSGSDYAPLKDLVDFLQKNFVEEQKRFNDQDYIKSYSSSKAQVFVDALKSYKFEDLYKSSLIDIAKYDYIGWKGLEAVKQVKIDYDKAVLEANQNKTPLSDDDKKIKADIELFDYEVAHFFENSTLKFEYDVLSKYPLDATGTQKKLDMMQAFESLFYQGFNPFDLSVGDRRIMLIGFRKTWFTPTPTDINGSNDLSRYRVDLDVKDPSNYLTDKVIVGGIVY